MTSMNRRNYNSEHEREREAYFFIRNVGARVKLLSSKAKQGDESTQAKIIVVLFR